MLKRTLYERILKTHLQDNVQARRMRPAGSYERVQPAEGEPELNSQLWMIAHREVLNLEGPTAEAADSDTVPEAAS
jgi:polyphosphate kinase